MDNYVLDTKNDDYYENIINNFDENNINLNTFNEIFENIYGSTDNNKKHEKLYCNDCNSSNVAEDTNNGIIICTLCGCVITNLIDTAMEWVNYTDESKKISTHGFTTINTLLPNASMSSMIKGKCPKGMRSIHIRGYMPYEERRLSKSFKIIQQKCESGHIPKCVEDDVKIFLNNFIKVDEGKSKNLLFRGPNMTGILSACMYYACKKNKIARTPKEISELFQVKISKVTKGIKMFGKYSKIKNILITDQLITPEQFIMRFCDKLGIKNQYINEALCIVNNINKIEIATEHNPVSIATGAIFLMIYMNKLNISRKYISLIFNVSLVTISKTFKKFLPFEKILLNNEICNKLQCEIKKYKEKICINNIVKPNFIKFCVIPPQNIFNILTIHDNNEFYIKKKLFNNLNDELDKLILRETFIYNKTMRESLLFIHKLKNMQPHKSTKIFFIQSQNEINNEQNINSNCIH